MAAKPPDQALLPPPGAGPGRRNGRSLSELAAIAERVAQVLKQEEERFGETLEHGMRILDGALAGVAKGGQLDGTTLFTLYDTYGFRWI